MVVLSTFLPDELVQVTDHSVDTPASLTQDEHEIAHDLCRVLEAVITSFISAHGGDLAVETILSGVEMTSAIWCRVALETIPAEEVLNVRAHALPCSEAHYEERVAGITTGEAHVSFEEIKSSLN